MLRPVPLIRPCLARACIAYSEHVGVYLQDLGKSGEITSL
jgi:hypothetical protein